MVSGTDLPIEQWQESRNAKKERRNERKGEEEEKREGNSDFTITIEMLLQLQFALFIWLILKESKKEMQKVRNK